MAGFIRYDVRNGVEYASVYRAKRVDGKKTNDIEWLGRVVDKEKGLYQSKRRGLFQYILNSNTVDYLPTSSEKLILDFGDSFFLNEMLVRSGFFDLNKRFFGGNTDTLLSLVFYRSLQGGANCYAQTWWEGSYARLLFPKASLASQRISEFMREIGDEQVQRDFFKDYLRFIAPQCSGGI